MKTVKCTTHIKLQNIVLATDLSEASMHATRYAISLAARYGGKLYAAHVISPDALALAHPEALDRILKETNDYTEWTLDELLAPARRQGLPCEALVGVGEITNVLGVRGKVQSRSGGCRHQRARRIGKSVSWVSS